MASGTTIHATTGGIDASKVGSMFRDDVIEVSLLLPADRAEALMNLARHRHETVGEVLRTMIDSANIPYEQISRILLVGGSCRIPYVRQLLDQEFKRPNSMASDLELVVCQGAAIHAAMFANPVQKTFPAANTVLEEDKASKDDKTRKLPGYRPQKDPWVL